jgi:hypothetical protein
MHFILDLTLFRADLRAITAEIVRLKRLLGTTWLAPMASEQRELCRLKLRATELCALRAFSRGKLHLRSAGDDGFDALQYHRRIAERLGPAYASIAKESA